MAAAWFVELALNVEERELNWQPVVSGSTTYTFEEKARAKAERIATELADMIGDRAIVRVRHRLGLKRGTFIPRPRPARNY